MKIVVLAGGLSTERDVSIISSRLVCKALREKGHQAVMLDVFLGFGSEGDDLTGIFDGEAELTEFSDKIGKEVPDIKKIKALRKENPSCFFGPNVLSICQMADMVYMGLHGEDGENGKVQAAFDLLGIRYTGSGYLGSALAMDKGMAKKVFLSAGIPTPKGFVVKKGLINMVEKVKAELKFPCVVKPCCGGSSVGVSMPADEAEYEKALEKAFSYEDQVVVEEMIRGRELSVGVLAGDVLPIIEIIPKAGFYDYETKYQDGMAEDVCPAEIDEAVAEKIQEYALKVYKELKLGCYARIDFLLTAENEMYCLEANTLPGMTPVSLLPQEALAVGISFEELCERIVMEARGRYKQPDHETY